MVRRGESEATGSWNRSWMRRGSQLLADAAALRVSMPSSRIRPEPAAAGGPGPWPGGLAATAFAHQAESLAFPDRQAQAVHGRQLAVAHHGGFHRQDRPGLAHASQQAAARPASRRGQRRRLAAALEALRAARREDAAPRRIDEIGRGAWNPRQGDARHRRPARDRSRSPAAHGYRDGAAGRRPPPPGRSRPPCPHTSRPPGRRARPPAPGYG